MSSLNIVWLEEIQIDLARCCLQINQCHTLERGLPDPVIWPNASTHLVNYEHWQLLMIIKAIERSKLTSMTTTTWCLRHTRDYTDFRSAYRIKYVLTCNVRECIKSRLSFPLLYLNNIMIVIYSAKSHISLSECDLNLLSNALISLKPKKYSYFYDEINYFCHFMAC